MKPTPELRRARLAASAIKGLTVKPGAGGRLLWYWEPNRAEKAHGWTSLKFGEDRKLAIAASESRNADVAAWRRGEPEPAGMEGEARTSAQATSQNAIAPLPLAPATKHHSFMTISDHIHRYRTQYLIHLSPGHQRTAAYNLVRAKEMFGDLLPSDIRPHHIAAWTDSLRGRGVYTEQGRQVSDMTAHNYLRTFRALLKWIENPHEKFGQPKGRHQIWEADDRAAFIAAAHDLGMPNMAFALKLAFYTGQRTADLLKFTEHQLVEMKFLLDPDVKAVLADKQGKVWGWQFAQGKGDVPMHIPFEPELLAELRQVITANRARDRAATPRRLLTHVLINDATGEPWLYRDFNRAWNRIKDHAIEATGRSDMDDLHWHDFRRSRVVELKRQGFTHDQIGQLTGHEPGSVDSIMKVYGPVDSNMTARVIAESHTRTKARGKA